LLLCQFTGCQFRTSIAPFTADIKQKGDEGFLLVFQNEPEVKRYFAEVNVSVPGGGLR
jgi:hypothetical protein